MFDKITGIKICGANFANPTVLDLFNPNEGKKFKTIKGTLLYGKNGSGKSTIAKGFRKIAGETQPAITEALAVNNDGMKVDLSEDEKKHIFVFDEEYVDKNVKLHNDHLDTIVMLGEQVDLSEKIDCAEDECNKAKDELESQEAILKEYKDSSNIKSPDYYRQRLRSTLQGDDSWAGRDKKIRGHRQNTSVRDDTYKQFLTFTPSKSRSELLNEFSQLETELENAKSGNSVIIQQVPSIPKEYISYNDEEIQQLLNKRVERPELTEREKYLLELVQTKGSLCLGERIDVFENKETTLCPYCLQPLNPQYKEDLVQSIKKVLNKTVQEYQKMLKQSICVAVLIDLNPFEQLTGYLTCKGLIKELESSIKANNDLLQQKVDNPYESVKAQAISIQPIISQLRAALFELEREREKHNEVAKDTDSIIRKLIRINSEIAYYDVIELAKRLEIQEAEKNKEEKHYEELKQKHIETKRILTNLQAQRSSVTIALDVINNCMKYIFFEDDRLKIEYDNGAYKLLSHGKSVTPCDVSVGERNIIALCYFFTNILSDQDEVNAYSKEYLIVIDDPVSSYDMENRIGILSFLKYKLSAFLEGNMNTKALVMTHDLITFYNIHKMFEEIIDSCKQNGYPNKPKFNHYELRGESLNEFQYKNRQEYTELIKIIYEYGNNRINDQEFIIGNIMRQVLETFSTFEFKKGIESISNDMEILSLLRNKKYESYFKNLMYRLVLHGGSHREEQVKSMNDLNFFQFISKQEKIRTAKDILCFIYLLNSPHLLAHLKDVDSDAQTTLESWCEQIKSRSATI